MTKRKIEECSLENEQSSGISQVSNASDIKVESIPDSINTNGFKKAIVLAINKKWEQLISQKMELDQLTSLESRGNTIAGILSATKEIHNNLVKLLSLYNINTQDSSLILYPTQEYALATADIIKNSAQYKTILSEIKCKMDALINLTTENEQNDDLIQETISELLKKLSELHYLVNTLQQQNKLKILSQQMNFFQQNQQHTFAVKNFNTMSLYSDELVERLLAILATGHGKVAVTKVLSLNNQVLKDSILYAITRTINMQITTLMPVRIARSNRNYLIGLVIKKDQTDDIIIIKFIDSYGSCGMQQLIRKANADSFLQVRIKEVDFIIPDISKVNNLNLNYPYALSEILMTFLDILFQEIKPKVSLKSNTKIKFVATGIAQQSLTNIDTGPYVVHNLSLELTNRPILKFPEKILRQLHQASLDQYNNPPKRLIK